MINKISVKSLYYSFLLSLFLNTPLTFAAPTQRYDEIVLQTQTKLHETDESFVFFLSPHLSDPDRNLYLVKKNKTGSGKTEFHALSADSNYQDFSIHLPINLHQTDKTYDFCLGPNLDLYVFQKTQTRSGRIEFFVLSKKSNYQTVSYQTKTVLMKRDKNMDDKVAFCLASNLDLFVIVKSNSGDGNIYFLVLPIENDYQKAFKFKAELSESGKTFEFCLAPNRDLYVIHKSGTESGMTEVSVLSAASHYESFSFKIKTALPETGDNFAFCLAPNLDLFAIHKNGSGSTALYVLSGTQKQLTHLKEQPHEGWKEISNLNAPNKQLTDGSAVKISQTASLKDSGASANSPLRAENEGKPSHTDQSFEFLNDGGQATVIKKEEPESEAEDPTYVQFLMNMSQEQIEGIASSLRQRSTANKNCVHLANAMIRYFKTMIIPDPKDVSEEECNLDTYSVELIWSDDPSLIKSEIGVAPSKEKRRRTSKDSYIIHSTILDAGPLEDLIPAQETTEITLGDEGEAIETRKFYDFGKYCQKKAQYSKLSGELKEIAKGNHPVKVSFGKINLGRKDPSAIIGHMIAYFATPENVWYIDLQQIEAGKGQAVYDSIENIVRFFDPQVTKKKNGQDPFNPIVFYVPMGPQFGGYSQGEKSK